MPGGMLAGETADPAGRLRVGARFSPNRVNVAMITPECRRGEPQDIGHGAGAAHIETAPIALELHRRRHRFPPFSAMTTPTHDPRFPHLGAAKLITRYGNKSRLLWINRNTTSAMEIDRVISNSP